jgi:hypothetical protein
MEGGQNGTTTFEGCAYIRRHRLKTVVVGGRARGDKPALQVNMGGGERFRKKMLNHNLIW